MSFIRVSSNKLLKNTASYSKCVYPSLSLSSSSFDHLTQKRSFHMTTKKENGILVAGLGVAGIAVGGKYLLEAYAAWSEKPKSERSLFKNFSRNFYDGPFESKMTRREAALILGVRESASAERIRNAHRKLLILNHPDTGGSTFIATKVNQAKELLLSGKE